MKPLIAFALLNMLFSHAHAVEAAPSVPRYQEGKDAEIEKVIARSETQALQSAQKLLAKRQGSPEEAGLLLRLAELQMKRAKGEKFFDMQKGGGKNDEKYLKQALISYQIFEKKFPKHKQRDVALYNQGSIYQSLNQPKRAIDAYQFLIAVCPKSPLLADAYMSIGEIEFDAKNFSKALLSLEKIATYQESPVYSYSLYKMAWSYYNLKNTDAAVQKLEQLLLNTQNVKMDLKNEALRDLVLFSEDHIEAVNARPYFSKFASSTQLEEALWILSQLFERHSRYHEEQILLTDILTHSQPVGEKGVVVNGQWNEVFARLVFNLDDQKKPKEIANVFNTYGSACGKELTCYEKVSAAGLKLIRKWEKEKKPARDLTQMYEVMIGLNLPAKQEQELRFQYAELLVQQKDYSKSQEQYILVSKSSASKDLKEKSAYGAIVSFERGHTAKWTEGEITQFSGLLADYKNIQPKSEYLPDLNLRLARAYFEIEKYAQAQSILEQEKTLLSTQGKNLKTQDFYLEILSRQKKYAEMLAYVNRLLPSSTDSQRKSMLKTLEQKVQLQQIAELEKEQNWELVITQYQKYIKSYPQSEQAAYAQERLIQLLFTQHRYREGAEQALEHVRIYPTSAKKKDMLKLASQGFEMSFQLSKAADASLQSSDYNEKIRAAQLLLIDGQTEKANTIFVQMLPQANAQERARILELIKMQYGPGWIGLAMQYGSEKQQWESQLMRATAFYEAKENSKAFELSKKIVGQANDKELKAKARLIQAQVLSREMNEQSLKTSVTKLDLVLAMKMEKFEKAQEAYLQASRYDVPEVTQKAMASLLTIYNDYLTSIKNIPTPRGLADADAVQLRAELDKLVQPLNEKKKSIQEKMGEQSNLMDESQKLSTVLVPTWNVGG